LEFLSVVYLEKVLIFIKKNAFLFSNTKGCAFGFSRSHCHCSS